MKKSALHLQSVQNEQIYSSSIDGQSTDSDQQFIEVLERYLRQNAVYQQTDNLPRWALWI